MKPVGRSETSVINYDLRCVKSQKSADLTTLVFLKEAIMLPGMDLNLF
jgi:hypothetical protein